MAECTSGGIQRRGAGEELQLHNAVMPLHPAAHTQLQTWTPSRALSLTQAALFLFWTKDGRQGNAANREEKMQEGEEETKENPTQLGAHGAGTKHIKPVQQITVNAMHKCP